MGNEAEIERWNGDMGARWAEAQEALDARIRAFGDAALAAAELTAGMRVLDVGCGCGDTALAAAAAVGPSGAVVGVDVSEPMLARARQRGEGLSQLSLRGVDASTFTTDQPFDRIVSRFGVMFFDEPTAAFENLRHALRKDGRLAFACWRSIEVNPWMMAPLSRMGDLLPPPAMEPPGAPGPFAFADEAHVHAVLEGAGFQDVAMRVFDAPMKMGATLDEATSFAARLGAAGRALREAPEELRPKALARVREALEPFAPTFELDASVWIVTARAP